MVRRDKGMGVALGLAATVALMAAMPSCSSKSQGNATLAQGCTLNSDCASPLICVFSLCHNACSESRDCPTGQRCVSVGPNNICELPSESTCSATQPCKTGLLCWTDLQCRNPCDSLQPCVAGETCVDNVCFSPTENPDGGTPEGGGADGSSSEGSPNDAASEAPPEAAPDAPFVPNPDAGVLGFTPSNFVPSEVDAGADWSGAVDADITASCTNCLPVAPTTISQNDGSLADVYVLKSLVIASTAGLQLRGPNPVILAVLGAVDIQGQILVNGSAGTPGPGGFVAGTTPGPGAGQPPYGSADPDSNGGGGSYCGIGGTAGTTAPPAAVGGPTYGNATITPLVGGSAGGASQALSAGGGAIQIVSGQSITVRSFGAIHAGGGGTSHINGTGGGASGGAILLEAPSVVIEGNVAANGGGGMSGDSAGADATANATPAAGGSPYGGAGSAGTAVDGSPGTAGTAALEIGGGGGGAGRIRINSASGSATITGVV
ncbi:MAG: hypothetical protein ACRELB_14975, partial [Polyangiaceae bacterium]